MRLTARAVDGSGSSFSATLPRVHAIDVRVRGRDPRDGWLETWLAADRSPVAVSIAFLGADGRAFGAAMVARIGLEEPVRRRPRRGVALVLVLWLVVVLTPSVLAWCGRPARRRPLPRTPAPA
jgi:hypothetical protein